VSDRELTVPDGWKATTLGEIGRYLNGKAFKPSDWSKTGRPIIRIQDLTGSNRNPNYFEGDVDERYVVRPGEFLISWSATLGAFIWDGPEAVLNQHIFKVESKIDKRFHYHLVRACIAELERNAHGSGMVHVTKGVFDSTPVAIPQDERVQQSIAALIDHAEDLQRSALRRLSTARQAIERFRQAVLAAAYAEASTVDDRDTVVPLSELLREPFKNGYSARPVGHETPFRVLTLSATTKGWFDARHFKYTNEAFPPDSPYWLMPGDIVIQRGNTAEYVGVPALYEGAPHEFLYPDLMIRVRVTSEIGPRFVWYMLLAPQARGYLRESATGSAGNMPKINQKALSDTPVPLPPPGVRRRLVHQLDRAMALSEAVAHQIDLAQRHVAGTSQAVLAKAFGGQLSI
jgi:type I restriction enzyme S subunit